MYQDEFNYVALPAVYTREDGAWIRAQLSTLPVGLRDKIALAYAQAYQDAFDAEQVSFRQQNAARRSANKRLREFCARYTPVSRGYTSPPPRVD